MGGDQVRDVRAAGRPCPATRCACQSPVKLHDVGRANGLFQVGLRAFDCHAFGPLCSFESRRLVVTIVTLPRRRLKADVIPRMLGTMPPSAHRVQSVAEMQPAEALFRCTCPADLPARVRSWCLVAFESWNHLTFVAAHELRVLVRCRAT